MADTTRVLNVEVSEDLRGSLEQLAERTGRDLPTIVNDALTQYVALQDWQLKAVEQSLAEIDAGARMVPNDAVMAWMESWGSPDELPPPA